MLCCAPLGLVALIIGVNAHAIKTYMGHSTIAFTFGRYGHLMPGNGVEAAQLLDAYVGPGDCRRQSGDLCTQGESVNHLATSTAWGS